MARRKSAYRVVRGQGKWFAWKPSLALNFWWPNVYRISSVQRGNLIEVTAVIGRTPFEALERLKRIERTLA